MGSVTLPAPVAPRLDPERSARAYRSGLAAASLVLLALPVACADDGPPPAPPPVSWVAAVEVAAGEGRIGPWRMNDSDWRYVDDPAVAIAAAGGVGVAWVDQASKSVRFQRFGPEGAPVLDRPANVSRSPSIFSWLPRVAFAPGGSPETVFVLWQEIVFSGGSHGGEAFFARSRDGGRTFEPPVNLSRSRAGDGKGRLDPRRWHNGSLDLAVDPAGTVLAAWTEYEGRLWVRRSTDRGRSFEPAVLVAGGDGEPPARGPSLAPGHGGSVHLAWAVGDDAAADLRLATSSDGGRSFREPRLVAPGEGHADGPALALDAGGTLHLAWGEAGDGPGGHYRIRYARSVDGGETFEAPRRLPSPAGPALASESFPAIALGRGRPGGRVYLLWELFPDNRRRARGLGFAVSRDGGATFSEPEVVPGSADPELGINGSVQGLARKITASGDGRIAVVESRIRPGRSSAVRLIRGRATRP